MREKPKGFRVSSIIVLFQLRPTLSYPQTAEACHVADTPSPIERYDQGILRYLKSNKLARLSPKRRSLEGIQIRCLFLFRPRRCLLKQYRYGYLEREPWPAIRTPASTPCGALSIVQVSRVRLKLMEISEASGYVWSLSVRRRIGS